MVLNYNKIIEDLSAISKSIVYRISNTKSVIFCIISSLIFLSATNLSQNASACECEDLKERTSYLINSDSIFSGRVKSVEKTDDKPSSYNVRFDVDKVWKGPEAKEIVIKSSLDTGLCGYLFEINQTLVVHAFNEGGILNDKGCGTLSVEYVADYIKFLDSIMQDSQEWKTMKIIGKYKNSDPPKPDQTFIAQYRVTNGTLISITGGQTEIIAITNTTEKGLLELKFPRNFPYTNLKWDGDFFLLINGYGTNVYYTPETTKMMDHVRDKIINKVNRPPPHPYTYEDVTDCHYIFRVPFYTYAKILIGYGANGLIKEPYRGDDVPENCINQTIIQPSKDTVPLEIIDDKLFFVSGPLNVGAESNEIISFHGVNFTHPSYPVPPIPGGVVFIKITFSDDIKESLSSVGAPHPFTKFTEHKDPQAGFRRNSDGTFSILVSADFQQIPPLKQFKAGIAAEDVVCKEGLKLIFKSKNDSPTCVKPASVTKLVAWGWAKSV